MKRRIHIGLEELPIQLYKIDHKNLQVPINADLHISVHKIELCMLSFFMIVHLL